MKLLEKFLLFLANSWVATKDYGLIKLHPSKLFGSQKKLIKDIFEELAKGSARRNFVILKARQLGITTITELIDLFWAQIHKGIKIAFLCQDYTMKLHYRRDLGVIYSSLPKHFKMPLVSDSREALVFKNGSSIMFFHEPKKGAKEIVRGQAITCLHSTETAFYENFERIKGGLLPALSEEHPARYVIYESTANGFNHFYDLWHTAENGVTYKPIFLGWWLKESYRIDPEKQPELWEVYSYRPNRDERLRMQMVKKLYGYELTLEQLAWWRMKLFEEFNGDEELMLQEYPFTAEDAFRYTGNQFIKPQVLMEIKKNILEIKPHYYLVQFPDYNMMVVRDGNSRKYNLKIWEYPVRGEIYFLGADPSYGANPDSDFACVSVWRVDWQEDGAKLVQVAEFGERECDVINFAKVCLWLTTIYNGGYFNLEVTGPGLAVVREIDRYKANNFNIGEIKVMSKRPEAEHLTQYVRMINEYVYWRADRLRPGGGVRHFKTIGEERVKGLFLLKSLIENKVVIPRSDDLLEQLKYMSIDDSGVPRSFGPNDDLVFGAMLAVEYFNQMLPYLPKRKQKELSRQEALQNIAKSVLIQ